MFANVADMSAFLLVAAGVVAVLIVALVWRYNRARDEGRTHPGSGTADPGSGGHGPTEHQR